MEPATVEEWKANQVHFGPPTEATQRVHPWLRALNFSASEIAEQRWPEASTPYCSDCCDHLRTQTVRHLQGSVRDTLDKDDGPPEMLVAFWWDVRFFLDTGCLPSRASDGRLMSSVAAARVRTCIDSYGRGMQHLGQGVQAEEACSNWPRKSVKSSFPDFFRFAGSFLDPTARRSRRIRR